MVARVLRKRKSRGLRPLQIRKFCFQRISFDLKVIMNAMFDPVTVPDFLAGDLDADDHSMKVKKANVATDS
ncbi:hypothetical protein L2E82_39658 [Cichorium intybus]|uniref:Uncharacterized protein n=1 Tax=Cichorium intybus TaxID=13427 RepID=A0ACB9AJT7_CICIN|nr:hypothetical protein L2E82_39658 [Cichorium intybus]